MESQQVHLHLSYLQHKGPCVLGSHLSSATSTLPGQTWLPGAEEPLSKLQSFMSSLSIRPKTTSHNVPVCCFWASANTVSQQLCTAWRELGRTPFGFGSSTLPSASLSSLPMGSLDLDKKVPEKENLFPQKKKLAFLKISCPKWDKNSKCFVGKELPEKFLAVRGCLASQMAGEAAS